VRDAIAKDARQDHISVIGRVAVQSAHILRKKGAKLAAK
jgi:hypothetical protein